MVKLSRRAFLRHAATGTGAVLFMASASTTFAQRGPQTYALQILHTNDHHARIEPVDGTSGPLHGGVSRRKAMIDSVRNNRRAKNLLLLDAGDVFQGTLWFNQYEGLADLEFYNAMQYDAVAIGNHEYDRGPQALANFISRASFPVLSANTTVDGSSPLAGLIKPWIIKEVGGEKIGIFGLTTEDTAVLSSPGSGVTFTPAIDAARRAVADLQAQGVNKIIALTHIGIFRDRELAAQVSGIGVIIGGHTHTPMGPMVSPPVESRPYPEIIGNPDGNPVVVATAWEWGRWLGDLTIGFDANGLVTSVVGPPVEVLPSIEPDQGFENRIAVLKAPLDALRNRVIGESAVELDGSRTNVRAKETNLGNLVADAMLERARADGAQIAITNGGGIRASIDAGPVTIGEVLGVLPFGNTLARVDITGAQVKEALENGVSQVETGAGRFPQVAGIRFSWDPAGAVGSRVTSIQVQSGGGYTPIDPAATYRVVTNNFMLTGGDGYSAFTRGRNQIDLGFILADVVEEYIAARSPVNATTDGRITEGAGAPGTAVPPIAVLPAELPRTGGELSPTWLLGLLAAGAIGAGMRLRERATRAPAAAITNDEVIAEESAVDEIAA